MPTIESPRSHTASGAAQAASGEPAADAVVPLPAEESDRLPGFFGGASQRPGALQTQIPLPGVAVALALTSIALLAAFYRRITPRNVLVHETRKRVHERAVASPGSTAADIAEREGLGYKTTVHHLETLARHHLLTVHRDGRARRYFVNGGSFGSSELEIRTLLYHPTARRIVELALEAPGVRPASIARTVGLSRPAIKMHVDRLSRRGVIRVERRGRGQYLSITPEHKSKIHELLSCKRPRTESISSPG